MAALHFCQQLPTDSMLSDVQTLNKFNAEQFEELLGIAFSFLADPTKSERLSEQLHEYSEQHEMNLSGLKTLVKTTLLVPSSALKKNLGPKEIKEDLINLGLSEEKASTFAEKYRENVWSLSRGALDQTLLVNQLVDMEWKFGVTAASSELNKVGNTFLQLKLTVNKGTKNENVYMELSLPQFYSFLHEMERARASLDVFS